MRDSDTDRYPDVLLSTRSFSNLEEAATGQCHIFARARARAFVSSFVPHAFFKTRPVIDKSRILSAPGRGARAMSIRLVRGDPRREGKTGEKGAGRRGGADEGQAHRNLVCNYFGVHLTRAMRASARRGPSDKR